VQKYTTYIYTNLHIIPQTKNPAYAGFIVY